MAEDVNLKNVAQQVHAMMEEEGVAQPAYSGPGVVNVGTRRPSSRPASASQAPNNPTPIPIDPSVDLGSPPNAPKGKTPVTMGITDEDLRSSMPDLSEEEFARVGPDMKAKLTEHQKNLIMSGFTVEEAVQATRAKLAKDGKEINDEWVDKHPVSANVVINKTSQDKIEFTEDERAKLTASKSIRLVVVEDEELKSIPVKKIENRHKVAYINQLTSGLSKYSVPMCASGDYMSFRGAQIMQMTDVISHDDDTLQERLMRKAQLLYDKFIDGVCVKRYVNGKEISFEDFCNEVAYTDLDMGMFAILCASNMEESSTELTCNNCKNTWTENYNIKKTMSTDGFSDEFKGRADRILAKRANAIEMQHEREFMQRVVRYKSPFTQNIYDLEIPSIAKANRVFNGINLDDDNNQGKAYIAAIALYMHTLYIYDKDSGEYIEIHSTDEEIQVMLDTLMDLFDDDIRMLINEINSKYIYTPTFQIRCKCPQCGTEADVRLQIENMVFQKAQDFYTQTQF